MNRKIKSSILLPVVLFLVCLLLATGTEAQLNFSTGWGKRNQKTEERLLEPSNGGCDSRGRPTIEQLYNLYNFFQIEARRILDCQKLNK